MTNKNYLIRLDGDSKKYHLTSIVNLIIKLFKDENYAKIEDKKDRDIFKRFYKYEIEEDLLENIMSEPHEVDGEQHYYTLDEIVMWDARQLEIISPDRRIYQEVKNEYEDKGESSEFQCVEFYDKKTKCFIIRR